MMNQSLPNPNAEDQRRQRAEGPSRRFYANLCALENLQQAYAYLKENLHEFGLDPLAFEAIEAEGVETFLRQLSHDLQTRTYKLTQTTKESQRGKAAALRDLVVQVALQRLLETVFPPAFPSDPQPEKTIQWLAGNIDRGFSRVYAVHLEQCLGTEQYKRLVDQVYQRIDDPDVMHLLAMWGKEQQGPLVPLLADIAFEGIDEMLQQARTLGREGNFLHLHCRRVANEWVILLDQDARYDWLLPAVQKRLREELSNLHYDLAAVETQSVDLTRGGQLCFLGFELHMVEGRHGEARTQYRPLKETNRGPVDRTSPHPQRRGRYHPLRWVQGVVNGIGRQWPCQVLGDACRKVQDVQVGWRHLPVTLFPVLLVFFGWRSPVPWLCLAAIFLCNWRWTLHVLRTASVWIGRHKLDTVLGAGVLTALIGLYPLASEIQANLSREEAVPAMPPGFSWGQYNKGSPLDAEWVHYALYVPPHFQQAKGPFPLLVYLHGYLERTKARLFKVGLPHSIVSQFGPNGRNGPFAFVAFFPIDPTGQWQRESVEVEDAMQVLDYVIRRHRIDPARVYLTGISAGGNGVWRLAEAYPDRWAAVVPLSSFISPDIQRVRHLPAWIFHGARDQYAPVQRERELVRQLQAAGTDVRYTEVRDKGHVIWVDAYDSKKLYDWLTTKKREDGKSVD